MPSQLLRLLGLLSALPVAGWAQAGNNAEYARSLRPRQYVLLSDSFSLGFLHYVKGQRGGRQFEGIVASGSGQGTSATILLPKTSVGIINLLVPAARVRQLAPAPEAKRTPYFLSGDTLLITMALLPHVTGDVSWQPVQLDTIPRSHLHSLADAVREGSSRISAYRKAGSPGTHALLCRDDLIPLMRWQGRYWAPSSYVLTEYFQIRQRPTRAFSATDLATINIKSQPIPKEALLREKRRQSGNAHAQLTEVPAGNILQRRDKGRYEFWSNPSVVLSHPDVLHYGSGEFQYQPGVGVVSSTYRAYFQCYLDQYTQYVLDEPFEVISISSKVEK